MKTKTKAILSIILVIGYFILLPIIAPTATLVQNTATLATVNGLRLTTPKLRRPWLLPVPSKTLSKIRE